MAVLLTTFGLIFLAELPDKTLYTVLLLASRGRTLPVLLGAWAAFLVHGLIAVALGALFARLAPRAVEWSAAALFIAFGLWLLVRREADDAQAPASAPPAHLFLSSFALVFAAEWGDATQIGTAALVARSGSQRWLVFLGATLALWTGTALAVTVGHLVGARMPKRLLRRGAGVLFLLFGIATALQTLRH
ncbi:MAG: TMEM165/GDT1 family protein [Myxococcales bacterium]